MEYKINKMSCTVELKNSSGIRCQAITLYIYTHRGRDERQHVTTTH